MVSLVGLERHQILSFNYGNDTNRLKCEESVPYKSATLITYTHHFLRKWCV
jgi:hypothetical protein